MLASAGMCGAVFLAPLAFENILLALMTGFFAVSALLAGLLELHPVGTFEARAERKIGWKKIARAWPGLAGGVLVGSIPSMTAHQSLALVEHASGKMKPSAYLVAVGMLETISLLTSIVVFQAIAKTRTGIAVLVGQAGERTLTSQWPIMAAALLASGIGIGFNRTMAGILQEDGRNWPWKKIYALTLAGLVGLVLYFQPLNIVPLACATGLGLACEYRGIPKTACMAFLTVPTLGFYLGF